MRMVGGERFGVTLRCEVIQSAAEIILPLLGKVHEWFSRPAGFLQAAASAVQPGGGRRRAMPANPPMADFPGTAIDRIAAGECRTSIDCRHGARKPGRVLPRRSAASRRSQLWPLLNGVPKGGFRVPRERGYGQRETRNAERETMHLAIPRLRRRSQRSLPRVQ